MADIFQGTEVPRWLQEAARPASGKDVGNAINNGITGLSSLFTAIQPDAASKLGLPDDANVGDRLQESAFQTRMSQQDPMWKAKWDLTRRTAMIGQQSKWMQMGLASAKIDNYQSGLAAKAKIASDFAQDQNDINEFTKNYGNNPQDLIDNGPELFGKIRTQQGRILASKMFEGAKASTDHITATNAGTLDRQTALKAASEFTKQLAALDVGNPEIGALYAKIKKEQSKPLGEQDTDMMYETLATAKARQAEIEAQNAKDAGLDPTKIRTGPTGTRTDYTAPKKGTSTAKTTYSIAPNGQLVANTPGYAPRFLNNARQQGEAKVAFDELKKSRAAYDAQLANDKSPDKLLPFANDVMTKQRHLDTIFAPPKPADAPAPASAPESAPAKKLTYNPESDTLE